MSWTRSHLFEGVTLTEHNLKVMDDLDHGPQSSLDDARADRPDDHCPALERPVQLALLPAGFWERIDEDGPNECWQWTGQRGHAGYGRYHISNNPRVVLAAHRLVYEAFVGPIPEGLHIDHLCRNRACVNPAHLEAVTNRENILRGVGITAVNAAKTHCKRGHEFTPENTYITPGSTRRTCRICRVAASKALTERRRAARVAAAAPSADLR